MIAGRAMTLRSVTDAMAGRGGATAVQAMRKNDSVTWSHATLADHTRHIAGGLTALGVERGEPVAILAENSPQWLAICLGLIHAGIVPVPIDVQMPADAMAHVLSDSGARFIATTHDGAEQLRQLSLDEPPTPILLDGQPDDGPSWEGLLQAVPADPEPPEVDDPAVLFYTSGTTGPPKGVLLSQGNLMFQMQAIQTAQLVREGDRVLLPLPLHHVYPFVLGMLAPLSLGVPIVLPRSLTGPQIVRALREGEVTAVIGVPRLYEALLRGVEARVESIGRPAAGGFRAALSASTALRRHAGVQVGRQLLGPLHHRFAPHLRVVTSGGSPLDKDVAWRIEGMGWRVVCGYGLTETSPLLTWNLPRESRFGTAGKPLPGVQLRIDTAAAPEGSERSERGHVIGEILARGPGVFRGYRNLPEKTAEAFTESGWYRTGDLGYIDEEGFLHVEGRVSTMIVTASGENVQPDQVEEQYEVQEAISEVGVLEKEGRLVALVVPAKGAQRRDEEAVREAMQAAGRKLPSHQRIADYTVTRTPLPRTRLGKIRRGELEQRCEQADRGEAPQPEQKGPVSPEQMSAEDRSLLSDPVARQVWHWLARHYPDEPLSPDSHLELDLGIDSMAWLDLTLEVGQEVGVELDEEAIAESETVRDLLESVAGAAAGEQAAPLEQPEQTLSERQRRWLEPLSGVQAVAAGTLFAMNRAVIRRLFHATAEGLDNLPDEPPFVIAANHLSDLDPFVLAAVLPEHLRRQTFWAGWAGRTMTNPFKRWGSRLFQAVPVEPRRAAISSLAFGAAVLKRKRNLMWFPEGERSEEGRLQSFRAGLGRLLEQYPVPVVPTVITGTYEALQRGRHLPRRHPVHVAFGAPLEPKQLAEQAEGDTAADRMMRALHDRMAAMGAPA